MSDTEGWRSVPSPSTLTIRMPVFWGLLAAVPCAMIPDMQRMRKRATPSGTGAESATS